VFFSGRIRNAVNDLGELGQVIAVALDNVKDDNTPCQGLAGDLLPI